MSDQLSDEMGAPGYPPGDETTQDMEQGAGSGDQPEQPEATTQEGGGIDTEQGAGEGDLDAGNEAMIRRRAFEISQGNEAGTPEENWARAEREVRTEQASP